MCHQSTLQQIEAKGDETLVTCSNCDAQFSIFDRGEGYVRILRLGNDPYRTNLTMDDLNNIVMADQWRDLDRREVRGINCPNCGSPVPPIPSSISFRTGKHTTAGVFVFGPLIGHLLAEGAITFEIFVCKKCRRIEFYLPEKKA